MMSILLRRSGYTFICILFVLMGSAGAAPGEEGYEAAARRNEELRHELAWYFGGKSQRGWDLYVPLINRLIGSDSEPGTTDFARALAAWQGGMNLAASGVLDQGTWMAMVATFQSQRLRRTGQVSPESLIPVPPQYFYDPERPLELRYVEAEAYVAYQRLYQAAQAAGISAEHLKIISAYRSPAYQAALRKRSPNSGRAGLAVNSPHFTGRALDLYVGGEPVSTADWNRRIQIDTPVYRWLVKHAHEFGFYPYFYEPWHWEYRGTSFASQQGK